MISIDVCASRTTRALGLIALLLALASVAGDLSTYLLGHDNLKGLVPLFDLDAEENIPTFFSVLLLLSSASLLALICLLNAKGRGPHTSNWAVLALGFLYMAYDEGFRVHELLMSPVRALLGLKHFGVLYFAWVVPGIAVSLLLAVYFLRFLLDLPSKTRIRFLIAAAVYLGGAIGFELIGGAYFESEGRTWRYSVFATVEESLEMAGVILFIRALLMYIASKYGQVSLLLNAPRTEDRTTESR